MIAKTPWGANSSIPTSHQAHYSEPIACRCLYHSSEDVSSQIPWHNPFTEDRIHGRQHSRHNSEPISPTTPLFSFSHYSQIPWRSSSSQDSHNHNLPSVGPSTFPLRHWSQSGSRSPIPECSETCFTIITRRLCWTIKHFTKLFQLKKEGDRNSLVISNERYSLYLPPEISQDKSELDYLRRIQAEDMMAIAIVSEG
jgi:hypothetical protein